MPVEISTLAARPPVSLVGGLAQPCAGPAVDPEQWWSTARAIEGELLYMNEAAALSLADASIQGVACLEAPVQAQQLAQVAFWRGLAQHYLGQDQAAAQDFAWARAADPELAWNEDLGDDGREVFEGSLPPARARLEWVAPGFDQVTVDGASVEGGVELVSGPHLLQLRSPDGAWLGLLVDVAGPLTRVGVPAALDDRSVLLADDVDGRAELSDLLAAALGPGEPVYVAGAQVWRGTAGRTDWVVVPGTRTVKRGRPAIVLAGGAVTLGGAIAAGVAYNSAAKADADRCDAETGPEWDDADARWRRARTLYGVGWSGIAIGVGLGATGALLPRQQVSAHVWVGPGGGGVRLSVTR